jgi:aminoglycoside phosphotransferase family enzyme/predicted kinase
VRLGEALPPAAVIETHVSILFFVDERVYKLRKQVQFGFIDFRDREKRREDCQREVTLNRRLAPDVYLGVADVQLNGEPIDHMVVMRRLPEKGRLASMARHGVDLGERLRQVAETMVSFHRDTQRSPEISSAATGLALQASWDANFSETVPFLGEILDPEVDGEIRSLVSSWIKGRQRLFDSRIEAGRICDGHGDLQAEDIFCLDDGVRILDCIEFSDQLRYGDVCADVAFLVMDLERLGRPDASEQFLDHYQDLANDRFPVSLVHHYIASRAYVRAKVACLRVGQGNENSRAEARHLHSLALVHLRKAQVKLVLIGGLPGSGKSTVAAGVARSLGWRVLRSDEVRRAIPGPTEWGQGYRVGRYTPNATAAVYGQLLLLAEDLLMHGESVIIDASWIDARWRSAAREVASRTESDRVELRCHVGSDVADARIVQRLVANTDVSEATPEVRMAMEKAMDPWPSSIAIDTAGATADIATARALAILGEARPSGG